MQKNENNTVLTLEQALEPIVKLQLNFREQRMLLHEMFTSTVANAPEDEMENYTANRLKDFYLALCLTFENLDSIDEIHHENIMFCMDRLNDKTKKA